MEPAAHENLSSKKTVLFAETLLHDDQGTGFIKIATRKVGDFKGL